MRVGCARAEDEQKFLTMQRTAGLVGPCCLFVLLCWRRAALSLLKQRLSVELLAVISNAKAVSAAYQVIELFFRYFPRCWLL